VAAVADTTVLTIQLQAPLLAQVSQQIQKLEMVAEQADMLARHIGLVELDLHKLHLLG
jgi:uncharacterized membrane protein